ncbi:MAG: bile acid:sodium symporter family protein, partial [Candidatus Competibacter sp.]
MTLDVAIAAVVWGLMWVVGLELTGDDFRRVVTQPRAVVAGTLGSLLLLPLLAAILLESGEWPPPVIAGLILL